mgnify:CR=1 FL=1
MRDSHRIWRVALFLLVQVALLGVYGWALTERTPITVWSSGRSYGARVGGSVMVAESATPPLGKVGLYATDFRSLRSYLQPDSLQSTLPAWVLMDLQRLFFGDADSAWDDLRIADANSGQIRLDERFDPLSLPWLEGDDGGWQVSWLGDYAPSSSGVALARTDELGDVLVNADLVRGRAPAGILVHADGDGNGMMLEVRPEHGDMLWWELKKGTWTGPVQSGAFRKSLVSMAQDNLRLLLRAYFAALFVLSGLALLRTIGFATRRVGRYLWRWVRWQVGPAPADSPAAVRSSAMDVNWLGGEAGSVVGLGFAPEGSTLTPALSQGEGQLLALSDRGMKSAISRFEWLALALLFLAALGLTGWVAYFLLERIPHVQDSVAYLFQAKTFALGRLWVPTPPKPEFFEHEFILNYQGKWFSKYPPGHGALLAIGVLLGHAWLVNPIAAAFTLVGVYILGREVYGNNVGWLAAGLGLVSPFWIFMSGSHMAHPTALLFITLFALLLVRGERERGWWCYPLAGACLGLALLIRPWTAATIASPFGLWALFSLLRRGVRQIWRYALFGLVFAVCAGAMLVYNAALTGDPFQNPQELWWPFDRVGFGEGYGGHGPHTVEAGLLNTQRNLTELMTHLFGWPAYLTLAFALAPFGLLQARRWDWLFLGAWLSLVAGYVAWWADGVMYGPRFYYESLSFLLLLTARGILVVGECVWRLSAILGRQSFPIGAAGFSRLSVAAVVVLVALNLVVYLPGQWRLYQGYNHVDAGSIRAVEQAGARNALVFTELGRWYEWWNYGSVFSSNSPLLNDDVLYARHLGLAKDRELMALYPDRKYYLLSNRELREIR